MTWSAHRVVSHPPSRLPAVRDPYTTLIQLTTGHVVTARSLALPELIEGARSGYAPYIGELRARYGDEVEFALEPVVGDAAAEVVDDAFMALPRLLPAYFEHGRFAAWIFGVAFNRARTRARSDRRRPDRESLPEGLEPSTLPSIDDDLTTMEVFERAMKVLLPSERVAWRLAFEGLQPKEIAEQLGISVNAATVRLHRARRRLGDVLSDLIRP
jgi:RNA polymerase sigma-70 factor, ECF subfamily